MHHETLPVEPAAVQGRPSRQSSSRPYPVDGAAARRRQLRLLAVLFAIYLALLVWVVLWKLEAPHVGRGGLRPVKLIPFVAAGTDAASDPFEVAANLMLFLPFGAYLRWLAPSCSWWGATALAAAASLLLESAQFALAIGSFDITDVIVNALGGLTGFALASVLSWRARRTRAERGGRRGGSLASAVRWCAVGTCAALLAVGAFVASPVHLVRPDTRPLVAPTQEH